MRLPGARPEDPPGPSMSPLVGGRCPLTHQAAAEDAVEGQAGGGRVPHGADDGVQQDGAQVAEEEPVGHEVAGVQHDGRQQVEEEDRGCEREGGNVVSRQDDATQHQAQHDEQCTLGDDAGDLVGQVEACGGGEGSGGPGPHGGGESSGGAGTPMEGGRGGPGGRPGTTGQT
eukprot:bmy_05102T0